MAKPEVKLKLLCHPRIDTKSRVSDDVLLHPRDNHGIAPGDIIELRHPDLPNPTLFLVKSLREDFPHKDAISIEQTLAQSIKLTPYKSVTVKVVYRKDVILDYVEVSFREQYNGRRDLMEFSGYIKNSIVQLNATLEFGYMRGCISELWRRGELASCGYVSDQTKIVYRSLSATFYIFIQMSREMWTFDEFGDLFFEKAIKFLRELILKSWNQMYCCHDVTLILSTRIFVDSPSVKIPENSVFSRNSDGRLYADFYNVIIQNERYTTDEWKKKFSQLMLAFKGYKQDIVDYVLKNLPGIKDPSTMSVRLSSARETNIFEGLNLAFSDYECYNIDRNFDRTGNACIVISPGCGVFDSNREVVSFTKQRALDLGVTVDLVCLGHQPLHAVPLFVCRNAENPDCVEMCIVPHWMNHSFFRSSREIDALNNSETVARINVKVRSNFAPRLLNAVRKDCVSAPGEGNFSQPISVSARRNTITRADGEPANSVSRMRAASLRDEMILNSAAVTSQVQFARSGVQSSSESVSSTQGWNLGGRSQSRRQSSICSETQSPPGGAQALVYVDPVIRCRQQPSWMSLYGFPALEDPWCRRYETTISTVCRQASHDVAHSYQSGGNLLPKGNVRRSRYTTITATAVGCHPEASASSWQPTEGGKEHTSLGVPIHRQIVWKVGRLGASKEGLFRTFPFGIHPELFGLHKTTSQKRWAHFQTAAHRMHLIKYEKTQCMKLLEAHRPRTNLSKIWHAYFAFHRQVLETIAREGFQKVQHQLRDVENHLHQSYSAMALRKTSLEFAIRRQSQESERKNSPHRVSGANQEGLSGAARNSLASDTPEGDKRPSGGGGGAWETLCQAVEAPTTAAATQEAAERAPASSDLVAPAEVRVLEKAFVSSPASAELSPHLSLHRQLLLEMLKPIGIDWKSLTTPALLPLTTEFFPEPSSLLGDDFQVHEYRIVLITVSDTEWNKHYDLSNWPGLAYSRRPLSGQQVLEELVAQRVAQGFQLCLDPEDLSSTLNGSSAGASACSTPLRLPSTTDSSTSTVAATPSQKCLPTPLNQQAYQRRALHSRSTAFRLRHQADKQRQSQGATEGSLALPQPTAQVSHMPVTPQPRFSMQAASPFAKALVPSKTKVYHLSTGSLFHSVVLNPDETITITKYQAKRTQRIDNFVVRYRYALRVPDSLSYLPVGLALMNRMVWAFNWSYLDNLVATHGVNECYELVSALKFWRSRFLLLPAFKETNLKLVDSLREAKAAGKKRVRCDIYETPLNAMGYERLCDRFIAFMEALNRIRRQASTVRVKQRHPTTPGEIQQPLPWAESSEAQRSHRESVTGVPSADSAGVLRRHGAMTAPSADLEGFKQSETTRSATATPLPPTPAALHPPSVPTTAVTSTSWSNLSLSTHSEPLRVLSALLDPECGINFMTSTGPLPERTFCGYDLTSWITRNLVDAFSLDAAVNYAQSLLDAGYICHASGNATHKFLNGFFLYTLLVEVSTEPPGHRRNEESGVLRPTEIDAKGSRRSKDLSDAVSGAGKAPELRKIPFPKKLLPPSSDSPIGTFSTDFQKEWMEVLVIQETPATGNLSTLDPKLLSVFFPRPEGNAKTPKEEGEWTSVDGLMNSAHLGQVFGTNSSPGVHIGSEGVLRKRVTKDLRSTSTAAANLAALKRHPEWYCLLYDLNYHPSCAFDLEIQWLVASPSRLNEILLNYMYYKATSLGFLIVPSPCYPLGYTGNRYSLYPMRLPIFIPCPPLLGPAAGKTDPYAVASELFPELPAPDQMTALFYFQEKVLSRFGFIPLSFTQWQERSNGAGRAELHKRLGFTRRMFVHVSGGMFAMIPLYAGHPAAPPEKPGATPPPPTSPDLGRAHASSDSDSTPKRDPKVRLPSVGTEVAAEGMKGGESRVFSGPSTASNDNALRASTTTTTAAASPMTAGLRRPVLDPRTSCFEAQSEVGFFWAWNHLLPRRWQGQTTCDEAFEMGLLNDFRAFCSGAEGDERLLQVLEAFRRQRMTS